jgi:hypothetical protein
MSITHRRRGLLALLMVFGLIAAACGGSDSGGGGDTATTQANEASDTGVTATTIKIGVGVADLDGLRAAGISLPAALTTKNLSTRITSYFDDWNAAGGINGRMIEPVVLTWDPTKPDTQDAFCAQATVDNELFAVFVSSGLNNKTVDCLLNADMLTYFGEFAAQASHDTDLLVTVAPPVEIGAESGAAAVVAAGTIPKTETIGVLAGNGPDAKAGAEAAKGVLEDGGYEVQVVEINTLQGDVGAINQEAGAAAGTFKAAGVSNVLMLLPFTNQAGFYDAAGTDITVTVLDTASANCTAFGASRTPAAAVGTTCITTWDNQNTAAGGVRTETPFEQECRAHFDEVFAAEFPTKSSPGVPSGQVITTTDGTQLSSDYDGFVCTLANVLKLSLENGGNNPTRTSVYDASLGLGNQPVALASDGQGTLKPDKSFLADFVHSVKLTAATAETPKGADGTYNGCPAPVTCWVPTSDRWFPIAVATDPGADNADQPSGG